MPLRRRIAASSGLVYREKRPSRVRPRSFILHIGVVLLLAAVTAGVAAVVVWLMLARPDLSRTPPRPAPSGAAPSGTAPTGATSAGTLTVAERLDAVKIVLAVVGGIGAIVVLTAGYRKQRNEDVAAYWEETKAFSDRFAKAAEMLGNDECAVRIGAVAALAQLADEWPGGRQQCIDTLCGYLRLPYASSSPPSGNAEVRRSIIREIRNHLRDEWSGVSWRGHRFRFAGAYFDSGELTGAVFEGGNVSFHGATFANDWFLFHRVEFRRTNLSFAEAEFKTKVTFTKAVFENSTVSFKDAKFEGEIAFTDAEVRGARLDFGGASRDPAAVIDWGPLAPYVPVALQ
ncbi:pentapeptide repeat-containing protein [Actinoplanes sp. CA-030573]|uniref:pentapeptide repeat-containing protein n=1 Tax=Actinoplanes sp. CA-030573 TaxID=3239898 RepID=UPI003D8CD51C